MSNGARSIRKLGQTRMPWSAYFFAGRRIGEAEKKSWPNYFKRRQLQELSVALLTKRFQNARHVAKCTIAELSSSDNFQLDLIRYVSAWYPQAVIDNVLDFIESSSEELVAQDVYHEVLKTTEKSISVMGRDTQAMLCVISLLERLKSDSASNSGCGPERELLSTALRVCGRNADGNAAELVHEMFRENSYPLDQGDYLALTTAYAREGNPSGAVRIVKLMIDEGMNVSDVVWTSVLDAFSRLGKIDEAEAVFRKIVTPDLISFSVMLRMYAWHGKIEMMMDMVDRMQEAKVVPNAPAMNPVLHLLVKNKHLRAAETIIEILQAHNVHPDLALRTILMRFFTLQGDEESLWALVSEIHVPSTNIETVNAAIKCVAKLGYIKEAKLLLKRLGMRADVQSYNSLLRSLSEKGCLRDSFDTVLSMRRTRVLPNSKTFKFLFTACVNSTERVTADTSIDEAFDLMRKAGVPHSISTLNIALEALIRDQRTEYAPLLLRMLKRCGEVRQNFESARFCERLVMLIGTTGNPRAILRVIRAYEKLGLASDRALRHAVRLGLEMGSSSYEIIRFLSERKTEPGTQITFLEDCVREGVRERMNEGSSGRGMSNENRLK
ncbi:hypothetical protein NDN08_001350 [Rhodosorus marinus]|uniref:Pentatricopeptide repeat-containing protein-mitochondrial domain-containing protein n=1 Tax=Rhodosorus marinus TaxID=101924 RepID=A0AAV8UQM7_9RHOD|nr:hypothetical protein NDN08_001350 [Rhodosorus marinus]